MNVFVSTNKSRLADAVPILRAFGADCGLDKVWGELNEECFLDIWGRALEGGMGYLVLLEDAGKVVGAMGVLVGPMSFWDKLSANEVFWYVLPEHRRGTAPIRMLRTAELKAKEMGCSVVVAGLKVFWNADKMARVYEVTGYRPHDLLYVKDI